MDKLRLRGKIISKSAMLDDPETFRDRTVLCFEVNSPGKLREYVKEANVDRQSLVLTNWSKDPAANQLKYFFALIGRLAEHWAGTRMISKKDKDDIYRLVVGMMDLVDENGEEVQSIKDLDTKELSGTIDMLKDWLQTEGADLTDLK